MKTGYKNVVGQTLDLVVNNIKLSNIVTPKVVGAIIVTDCQRCRTNNVEPRAFFKKLPVGGGGGVHKGPFGYDRRDQKIVGYADIVSIFIIE